MFALLLILAGCGGGGGGGGGGTTRVSVQGRVLWIETGAATSPPATVSSGSDTTTTDPFDGFFALDVNSGTNKVSVNYTPTSGNPIAQTFSFPALTADSDIGDLYIGPQVVTLTGTLRDASNGSPIGSATVSIGGRYATSNANGTFTVAGVAYSPANPSVFLGLDGVATATSYFARHFSPESLPSGGVVQIGTLQLTPIGSQDPPPPPYNVQGTVLPSGQGGGAIVQLKVGASVLRSVTADGNGRFTFWAPANTYTVVATLGSKTGQSVFTLSDVNVIKTVNVTLP